MEAKHLTPKRNHIRIVITILVAALLLAAANVVLATMPASAASTIVVGGKTLYAQNNPHAWGNCNVQDFKDKSGGNWVIVSWGYWKSSTHTSANYVAHAAKARNGMLFGWFDQGGAPKLGCPMNDEYSYMNGVRQDFQAGSQKQSLYWISGMDHAARIDPGREGAISWAWSHNNQVFWPGLCLQFVVYSYINGQHWTLKGPYGDNVRAVDWWSSSLVPGTRHAKDFNPPRGALVFWDYWAGGTGHAALSLGGGWVISTEFNGTPAVHVFKITDVPSHYKGWINPA